MSAGRSFEPAGRRYVNAVNSFIPAGRNFEAAYQNSILTGQRFVNAGLGFVNDVRIFVSAVERFENAARNFVPDVESLFLTAFAYYYLTVLNSMPLICLYCGLVAPNKDFTYAFTSLAVAQSPLVGLYNDWFLAIRELLTVV